MRVSAVVMRSVAIARSAVFAVLECGVCMFRMNRGVLFWMAIAITCGSWEESAVLPGSKFAFIVCKEFRRR